MKPMRWSLVGLLLVVGACGGGDSPMVPVDGGGGVDALAPDASSGADIAVGPDVPLDGAGIDVGGASDAGAADATAVACTPGTKRCAGNVAEVCVAGGNAWNQLSCANGCELGACKPLSLEAGWKVHQYDLVDDSIKTPASYTFENNGLVAVQAANPMASVYYNDTPLPEGVVVTGKFGVHTTSDDDIIGFVFGWQDAQHFYLFDWKQATQNDGTCGLASAGASLKVVNAGAPIAMCADFWRSTGTDSVKPIVDTTTNPMGWKDNVDYDLRLVFRPGAITIEVMEGSTKVVDITSTDTTYRSGKFGFFNYSQQSVRYEFFSISPI